LTLTGEFLWLKIDPTVKNRMPMLLAFSILNRCATVDEAKALLESLPEGAAAQSLRCRFDQLKRRASASNSD
jgi:hypothetical protein